MKSKIAFAVVAVLLLMSAFGLGYKHGYTNGRSEPRILVARDVTDTPQADSKGEYDHYFDRRNQISERVK